MPWITFEFLIAELKHKSYKTPFLWFLVSELTLLYKFSVAAMLISFLWLALFIFRKNSKLCYFSKVTFILIFLLNMLIVVFKVQYLFSDFLTNILHKSPTLSGRTYIWDQILKDVKDNPFLGIGMQSVDFDKMHFFESSGIYQLEFLKVAHGHNSIMTVLYRSGILGTLVYLYCIYIAIKKIQKIRARLMVFY